MISPAFAFVEVYCFRFSLQNKFLGLVTIVQVGVHGTFWQAVAGRYLHLLAAALATLASKL